MALSHESSTRRSTGRICKPKKENTTPHSTRITEIVLNHQTNCLELIYVPPLWPFQDFDEPQQRCLIDAAAMSQVISYDSKQVQMVKTWRHSVQVEQYNFG